MLPTPQGPSHEFGGPEWRYATPDFPAESPRLPADEAASRPVRRIWTAAGCSALLIRFTKFRHEQSVIGFGRRGCVAACLLELLRKEINWGINLCLDLWACVVISGHTRSVLIALQRLSRIWQLSSLGAAGRFIF